MAYWQQLLLTLLAVVVFCFWYFLYPHVVVMREIPQLFLWNSDYLMERLVLPGGLAQYLSELIVQFFLNPITGACVYAVLFVVTQWLTVRLLRRSFPVMKEMYLFPLSLIPSLALWRIAMIPYIPLTPTIAILMVLAVMNLLPERKKPRLVSVCLLIPVLYWLAGPAAILLILCCLRWIPLTATLFAACLIGSAWLTPYPLRTIATGIDYSWKGEKDMGTYEEMECDMLIRMKKWDTILRQFRHPVSPAVRSATLLATYHSGQVGQQELLQKMIVPSSIQQYEPTVFNMGGLFLIINFGSLSSAFMVSDMALLMNLPNISQRAAFEAMEFIPNYNKSGRALKRLTETCIITRQYKLAQKYLSILEQTTFYRDWARQMRPLTEHPELIKNYPFYQKAQEAYTDTDDLFFI